MKSLILKSAIGAALTIGLATGCATTGIGQPGGPDGQAGMSKTTKGAIIGSVVGAVAGVLTGDDAVERRQRALVGVGAGGLAGGAIGNYQDRQERALRDQLAGSGVGVVRQGDNITLNMPGNVTFDFDRSDLTAEARSVVTQAANYAKSGAPTRVLVVGHTDTSGNAAYNMGLSNRRARTVADALVAQGVNGGVISLDGKGETQPAKATGDGVREPLNRRATVDINF